MLWDKLVSVLLKDGRYEDSSLTYTVILESIQVGMKISSLNKK